MKPNKIKKPYQDSQEVIETVITCLDNLIDEAKYEFADDIGWDMTKTKIYTNILLTIAKVYELASDIRNKIYNNKKEE